MSAVHKCGLFCGHGRHAEFLWCNQSVSLVDPDTGVRHTRPATRDEILDHRPPMVGSVITLLGADARILAVMPVDQSPIEPVAELRADHLCELWLWEWV